MQLSFHRQWLVAVKYATYKWGEKIVNFYNNSKECQIKSSKKLSRNNKVPKKRNTETGLHVSTVELPIRTTKDSSTMFAKTSGWTGNILLRKGYPGTFPLSVPIAMWSTILPKDFLSTFVRILLHTGSSSLKTWKRKVRSRRKSRQMQRSKFSRKLRRFRRFQGPKRKLNSQKLVLSCQRKGCWSCKPPRSKPSLKEVSVLLFLGS